MRYKVLINQTAGYVVEVEADSKEEAEEEADNILSNDGHDAYCVDVYSRSYEVQELPTEFEREVRKAAGK